MNYTEQGARQNSGSAAAKNVLEHNLPHSPFLRRLVETAISGKKISKRK